MSLCNSCSHGEDNESEKVENVSIKEIRRERKAHFIQFVTIISGKLFYFYCYTFEETIFTLFAENVIDSIFS